MPSRVFSGIIKVTFLLALVALLLPTIAAATSSVVTLSTQSLNKMEEYGPSVLPTLTTVPILSMFLLIGVSM